MQTIETIQIFFKPSGKAQVMLARKTQGWKTLRLWSVEKLQCPS